MELLTDRWLSQLEAEDFSFLHQWDSNPIAQQPITDTRFNNFSTENFSSYYPSSSSVESCYKKSHVESSFPSVNFISFGESNSSSRTMDVMINSEADMMSCKELNFHDPASGTGTGEIYGGTEYGEAGKNVVARTPLQAQDHILAERKRRQKLADRFIALSAIVPGLKKLDKASVLGGAIKYLKELEERITILEENKKRQHDQEPAVSSKRPRVQPSYDDTSSSDVDIESSPAHPSPEIEVKISGDEVLLRVCCNKTNGIMKEMLREVEKLPLSVTSSNVMPFGNNTLSITIIAQMDGDLGMTAQDFARNIRQTIIKIVQ